MKKREELEQRARELEAEAQINLRYALAAEETYALTGRESAIRAAEIHHAAAARKFAEAEALRKAAEQGA